MADPVCWLRVVESDGAEGPLDQTYEQIKRDDGSIHNLYKAMSLRPEVIGWADKHYRAVMHSSDNTLPDWFLELVATMVARQARCTYATTHHGANYRDLFGDANRADAILEQVEAGREADVLDGKLAALVSYARKVNERPEAMCEQDVTNARDAGADDGEILEVAQTAASFAYWARIINAIGIHLGDEPIGRYGAGATSS